MTVSIDEREVQEIQEERTSWRARALMAESKLQDLEQLVQGRVEGERGVGRGASALLADVAEDIANGSIDVVSLQVFVGTETVSKGEWSVARPTGAKRIELEFQVRGERGDGESDDDRR